MSIVLLMQLFNSQKETIKHISLCWKGEKLSTAAKQKVRKVSEVGKVIRNKISRQEGVAIERISEIEEIA